MSYSINGTMDIRVRVLHFLSLMRFQLCNLSLYDSGSVKQGQCGRCDGLVGVDTLGVMEFDTKTDTFIGKHLMPDGAGGDPFGSPDGRHVVLVGRNGGEVVRILAAGAPGEVSVSEQVDRCMGT